MLGLILFIYGFVEYKRKNYFSFYVIFFLFNTNGYQIIPDAVLILPAIGITKSFDYASLLLLIIIITEYGSFVFFIKKYKAFTLPLTILFICVFCDFLFSKIIFNYSWNSIIRSFRVYIFLLTPYLFIKTNILLDKKFLKFIVIVTTIQSVLYLSQILLHVIIIKNPITGDTREHILNGYTRYYNLPAFCIPSLIYLTYNKIWTGKYLQNIVILILAAVIIGPLHRNLILTVFPVILLFKFVFNPSRNFAWLAMIPLGFLILQVIPVVGDRINQGFGQITGTAASLSNVRSALYDYDNSELNTSTFRYLHFAERYLYVASKPDLLPFGLGMLEEDAPQAKKLNFKVGSVAEDSLDYRPKQIDTGDIAWSTIILTTGFIGLLAMLYFIFYYFWLFYKYRFFIIAKVILIWLTILFFTSFFGTEILSEPFRVFFSFLLCLLIKSVYYNKRPANSSVNIRKRSVF